MSCLVIISHQSLSESLSYTTNLSFFAGLSSSLSTSLCIGVTSFGLTTSFGPTCFGLATALLPTVKCYVEISFVVSCFNLLMVLESSQEVASGFYPFC